MYIYTQMYKHTHTNTQAHMHIHNFARTYIKTPVHINICPNVHT